MMVNLNNKKKDDLNHAAVSSTKEYAGLKTCAAEKNICARFQREGIKHQEYQNNFDFNQEILKLKKHRDQKIHDNEKNIKNTFIKNRMVNIYKNFKIPTKANGNKTIGGSIASKKNKYVTSIPTFNKSRFRTFRTKKYKLPNDIKIKKSKKCDILLDKENQFTGNINNRGSRETGSISFNDKNDIKNTKNFETEKKLRSLGLHKSKACENPRDHESSSISLIKNNNFMANNNKNILTILKPVGFEQIYNNKTKMLRQASCIECKIRKYKGSSGILKYTLTRSEKHEIKKNLTTETKEKKRSNISLNNESYFLTNLIGNKSNKEIKCAKIQKSKYKRDQISRITSVTNAKNYNFTYNKNQSKVLNKINFRHLPAYKNNNYKTQESKKNGSISLNEKRATKNEISPLNGSRIETLRLKTSDNTNNYKSEIISINNGRSKKSSKEVLNPTNLKSNEIINLEKEGSIIVLLDQLANNAAKEVLTDEATFKNDQNDKNLNFNNNAAYSITNNKDKPKVLNNFETQTKKYPANQSWFISLKRNDKKVRIKKNRQRRNISSSDSTSSLNKEQRIKNSKMNRIKKKLALNSNLEHNGSEKSFKLFRKRRRQNVLKNSSDYDTSNESTPSCAHLNYGENTLMNSIDKLKKIVKNRKSMSLSKEHSSVPSLAHPECVDSHYILNKRNNKKNGLPSVYHTESKRSLKSLFLNNTDNYHDELFKKFLRCTSSYNELFLNKSDTREGNKCSANDHSPLHDVPKVQEHFKVDSNTNSVKRRSMMKTPNFHLNHTRPKRNSSMENTDNLCNKYSHRILNCTSSENNLRSIKRSKGVNLNVPKVDIIQSGSNGSRLVRELSIISYHADQSCKGLNESRKVINVDSLDQSTKRLNIDFNRPGSPSSLESAFSSYVDSRHLSSTETRSLLKDDNEDIASSKESSVNVSYIAHIRASHWPGGSVLEGTEPLVPSKIFDRDAIYPAPEILVYRAATRGPSRLVNRYVSYNGCNCVRLARRFGRWFASKVRRSESPSRVAKQQRRSDEASSERDRAADAIASMRKHQKVLTSKLRGPDFSEQTLVLDQRTFRKYEEQQKQKRKASVGNVKPVLREYSFDEIFFMDPRAPKHFREVETLWIEDSSEVSLPLVDPEEKKKLFGRLRNAARFNYYITLNKPRTEINNVTIESVEKLINRIETDELPFSAMYRLGPNAVRVRVNRSGTEKAHKEPYRDEDYVECRNSEIVLTLMRGERFLKKLSNDRAKIIEIDCDNQVSQIEVCYGRRDPLCSCQCDEMHVCRHSDAGMEADVEDSDDAPGVARGVLREVLHRVQNDATVVARAIVNRLVTRATQRNAGIAIRAESIPEQNMLMSQLERNLSPTSDINVPADILDEIVDEERDRSEAVAEEQKIVGKKVMSEVLMRVFASLEDRALSRSKGVAEREAATASKHEVATITSKSARQKSAEEAVPRQGTAGRLRSSTGKILSPSKKIDKDKSKIKRMASARAMSFTPSERSSISDFLRVIYKEPSQQKRPEVSMMIEGFSASTIESSIEDSKITMESSLLDREETKLSWDVNEKNDNESHKSGPNDATLGYVSLESKPSAFWSLFSKSPRKKFKNKTRTNERVLVLTITRFEAILDISNAMESDLASSDVSRVTLLSNRVCNKYLHRDIAASASDSEASLDRFERDVLRFLAEKKQRVDLDDVREIVLDRLKNYLEERESLGSGHHQLRRKKC